MRIGITCYPSPTGSGAVAAELGRQLARRGHVVHFISYRIPFGTVGSEGNVFFHEIDATSTSLLEYPAYGLALAAKMAEVARDHALDLLHVHSALPHAVTAFLARRLLGDKSPRLVTTLHGPEVALVAEDRSFYDLTRFGVERSDAVSAVSDFLRRLSQSELQLSRPVEVIPNFVDTSIFRPGASSDLPALSAAGERVLVHRSNFRPARRALDAVRILERVQREVPSVLLMIGDGPERASTQALARRLGLADRVRFLGHPERWEEIVARADVALVPSEVESFGMGALQAMAAGVPVIGTDAGGLPEVVRHAETGYLLPVGDVDGMAARTLEVLKDAERAREMGRAGRRRAEALFGAERVVARYERLYEAALASPTV